MILTSFGLQEWAYKVCELHKKHEQREAALHQSDTWHGLRETQCDERAPTFDHQLLLDYHFPLGYFSLTLTTGRDSVST